MNPREAGFLLLTGKMGNPDRKNLTTAQLRTLAQRVKEMPRPEGDRELETADLMALGYGEDMARRILSLLAEEDVLAHYLCRGRKLDCCCISRVSEGYPQVLKDRLGPEAPGCLWAKGDLSNLDTPMIALVGSRELNYQNREFAREVGRQAALQGYTLVSGNARGADRTAQEACLASGGRVISIVADELAKQPARERMLYISEDGFDEEFSAQRALSRNRCIHALGQMTFVAQCSYQTGGTWDGTVKNLRFRWSPVYVFADGSAAGALLAQMGAQTISTGDLARICDLQPLEKSFLE